MTTTKKTAKKPTRKKSTSATKLCSKVIKREGINSRTGRLMKGYEFVPNGNGRVRKVKPKATAKKATAKKKTTTKRKTVKK